MNTSTYRVSVIDHTRDLDVAFFGNLTAAKNYALNHNHRADVLIELISGKQATLVESLTPCTCCPL